MSERQTLQKQNQEKQKDIAQQKQISTSQKIQENTKENTDQTQPKQKQAEDQKQKSEQVQYKQEIPDKFYDSDLASVNEKDFLSDNQPPKDIIHERKLLHKQKKLHIFKTIMKVGYGIDKPAPFDQIKLRFKIHENTSKQGIELAKKSTLLKEDEFETYNLGKKHEEIQKLVTSMKKNETAMFQLQWVEVSKKSNIKVLKEKQVYIIEVQNWTTAIDIDGNSQVLKYLLRRGEGPFRVSKYDEVKFNLSISYKGVQIVKNQNRYEKIEQETIENMHPLVWKLLSTMKSNQLAKCILTDINMRVFSITPEEKIKESYQNQEQQNNQSQQNSSKNGIKLQPQYKKYKQLLKIYKQKVPQNQNTQQSQNKNKEQKKDWQITIQIKQLISIDDIYMNGQILKKILTKGVSTAKPDSSSLIYYALKFLDDKKNVLYQDACFDSDWWEDYGKLDILGCRKNFMDQFKMSQFLKESMTRMKPAQIAEIQCRNMEYFKNGHDYEQLQKLWPKDQEFPPKRVNLIVRVYNFTEGRNCFNMDIQQKIQQSKRKKIIAVKLLNQGNIQKAYKRFQNIVSFYNSGQINQSAYEQKISALMNSILCLMKQNKYAEMIPLCNIVLERPKHGFDQNKMKLNAQGIKVEGNVKSQEIEDSRQAANLDQNPKIIEKCLYRKGLALCKIGQCKQALECLNKIQSPTEEVISLKTDAEKKLQIYEDKSKKIFKSMFGS